MRLIDKDRLLKGTNHYLMRLDEDSIALGDIESIDVRFVEMAEEVKAIPIDWITNYLHELNKQAEEEMDFIINELGGYETCYKMEFVIGIEKMLEKWEKENELDKVQ